MRISKSAWGSDSRSKYSHSTSGLQAFSSAVLEEKKYYKIYIL